VELAAACPSEIDLARALGVRLPGVDDTLRPRMAYLTEASKAALTAAVESIEQHSSAELVIAVRAHSGGVLAADLIAGALAALATLAFLLFSPIPFSLPAILLDPLIFGALGAWLCSRSPGLRHALLPRRLARESVRRAARAEFFDGGIADTRGRTGILIYVSQTERALEALADSGVRRAIDAARWEAWTRELQHVVRHERDGLKLAAAICALAEPLALCLPRAEDDVNELADQVRG
jgi:putative membrane protein